MADPTSIEWVVALARLLRRRPATWNPIDGCSRASAGCRHCYAAAIADRYGAKGKGAYAGLTERDGRGLPRFNGTVRLAGNRLDVPLRKREPRVYFVGDMADLFHERVEDAWLDRIFAVMAVADLFDHWFLLLTKRPERMAAYLAAPDARERIAVAADGMISPHGAGGAAVRYAPWPLPNVWLGTSVEDQAAADARIPHLLATPAAKRFVICEPLLGPVDLTRVAPRGLDGTAWTDALEGQTCWAPEDEPDDADILEPADSKLDWVIVGGESGPGARPMHPDWAWSLNAQCAAAGVPFHFKQWGAWTPRRPAERNDLLDARRSVIVKPDGGITSGLMAYGPDAWVMDRVGKKAAGRLLDGHLHDEVPEVAHG